MAAFIKPQFKDSSFLGMTRTGFYYSGLAEYLKSGCVMVNSVPIVQVK
ncbi:MAG: hypothetical protein JWR72_573 [Flavisolibacter sp.]|jgi:hypothetical protein|nr:hypothetical protein [Flavisolibacter sp.]